MEFAFVFGFLGAGLLLLAFFMSSFKVLSITSKPYLLMNIAGAGLACYSSFLIGFMPFVLLESVWAFVALVALVRKS